MNVLDNVPSMGEVPTKPRTSIPENMVPIPMQVRDIKIISGNPKFTRDHLHTHKLADYARESYVPILLSNVYNPIDWLFADNGVD